ncbi:MAG: RecX family transcriptional regulator [Bacteroidales bacterium]|nr:RecX family transcriptional regulator [Bacteroidales bacterium]
MDELKSKVLSRLQAQCSRREFCSGDILSKAIKALDGDADAAAEVLESLVADGYVDDLRYSSAFARDKAQLDGWGPIKIRHALACKGISREIADAALQEIDESVADVRLQKLMAAKAKTLEGDPQARLKLIKYALSRGYEYSQVQKCL